MSKNPILVNTISHTGLAKLNIATTRKHNMQQSHYRLPRITTYEDKGTYD